MIVLVFFAQTEAATGCVLQEKVLLETSQDSQENTCARVFWQPLTCSFVEALTQVFSQEFCQISQKCIFIEHLWATSSEQIINTAKVQFFESSILAEM